MVECQLPKLKVASSSLVARSIFFQRIAMTCFHFSGKHKLPSLIRIVAPAGALMIAGAIAGLCSVPGCAQQVDPATPVVVQPGAPGQPTRILPPSTRATLPPRSPKDVEFMQGMIMHHAQAVEMTALMESRTDNQELRLLGARISHSQAEEIKFMERWLEARGEPTSMPMPKMSGMDMPGMDM